MSDPTLATRSQARSLMAATLFTFFCDCQAVADDKVLLLTDDGGLEVTTEHLNHYFSAWAPGRSPAMMATVPNIELALESLYISERLAAVARESALIDASTETWLQHFLVNRELMQGILGSLIEERLEDTDWEGLAEDYYLSHPEEFMTPEQVRASHILFKFGEQRLIETMTRADLVRDRILAGEAFAEVASSESEDAAAKPDGDLGFFSRDRMVPAFEEATFALKEGEVSDLVLTRFGVHIIKLTDRKEESAIPFEEVKSTIIKDLKPKIWRETREQILNEYRAEMLSKDNFINSALIDELRAAAAD